MTHDAHFGRALLAFVTACFLPFPLPAQPPATRATLLEARKIWDYAPHNAFTDLLRCKGRWYCVFREGQGHVSPDGVLRIITSKDGTDWTSAAVLSYPRGDLRDAKITVTPQRELMLSGAVAFRDATPPQHQSLAWFSRDGQHWSAPVEIGDVNFWLWRTTWKKKTAYSIGYETTKESFLRLYSSADGRRFDTLVPRLHDQESPNETSIVFLPNETALCLLRRDGNPGGAQIGSAKPPYTAWTWKDLGTRIGGPHLLRLPDGRLVAAGRRSDGKTRTSLMWLDAGAGTVSEFLVLPSGGDTSYPGLAWEQGLLWVSYYSSHESKTSIYLAKVKVPRS